MKLNEEFCQLIFICFNMRLLDYIIVWINHSHSYKSQISLKIGYF